MLLYISAIKLVINYILQIFIAKMAVTWSCCTA